MVCQGSGSFQPDYSTLDKLNSEIICPVVCVGTIASGLDWLLCQCGVWAPFLQGKFKCSLLCITRWKSVCYCLYGWTWLPPRPPGSLRVTRLQSPFGKPSIQSSGPHLVYILLTWGIFSSLMPSLHSWKSPGRYRCTYLTRNQWCKALVSKLWSTSSCWPGVRTEIWLLMVSHRLFATTSFSALSAVQEHGWRLDVTVPILCSVCVENSNCVDEIVFQYIYSQVCFVAND